MFWRYTMALLLLMGCITPATAGSPGSTGFRFTCMLGKKAVHVTTEGDELVYRYGATGHPELMIRGSARSKNVFYQAESANRSDVRQLRFAKGEYSYVLASHFESWGGREGSMEDSVRFFVLRGTRVIRSQACRGAVSFLTLRSESMLSLDQLEGLPEDTAIPMLFD